MRPADWIHEASDVHGEAEIARRCAAVLRGGPATPELVTSIGGPGAVKLISREANAYWLHVWAIRALLYVWDETVASTVISALGHDAWRVREMAAKVIALREIGAADELAALADDSVPRVRAAVARALGLVGEGEHAEILHELASDVEVSVRIAAERALTVLARRLDRYV